MKEHMLSPSPGEDLSVQERAVVDILMRKIIETAREQGIDVMGIDYPAIAVRDSLSAWVIAARTFPRMKVKSEQGQATSHPSDSGS